MPNKVDIANRALSRVGVTRRLSSLVDGSLEAQEASLWYDATLEKMLRRTPWPFATVRATLAVASGITRTDWDYVYVVPDDCWFVHFPVLEGMRNPRADERPPYRIEAWVLDGQLVGKILLTDLETVELVYTSTAAIDPNTFDPDFIDALVWGMASELARSLPKDWSMSAKCEQQYELAFRRAAAAADNESQPDQDPISSFEASRS